MSRITSIVTTAALALGLGAFVAPAVLAGGVAYCVTCKKPEQTYVCRVTGEGSRLNDALKLYCIVRLAKEGKHASCRAKSRVADCDGIERTYSYNGPAIPDRIEDDPRVQKLMRKAAREQKAFEKPEGDGPQTLVDLTGRAISASRKGWRNMRDSIRGDPDEPGLPGENANRSTDAAPGDREAPIKLTPPPPRSTAALPEPPPLADAKEEKSESRFQRMKTAVKGAGSAVGGFAGKSYRCVRSLFRNCRSETASADPQ
jgi:hypothetical protein